MTEIGEYNEVMFCEDDIAFTDCLFNKKRCNNDLLIYPDVGRPYVSPKYIYIYIYMYIKFVINYSN